MDLTTFINNYFWEIKKWIWDGTKILLDENKKLGERIEQIEAHHLIGFLLVIMMLYLLSFVISRIFVTFVKVSIMIFLLWMLWMIFFDRKKYNEIFRASAEINIQENLSRGKGDTYL